MRGGQQLQGDLSNNGNVGVTDYTQARQVEGLIDVDTMVQCNIVDYRSAR